MERPQSIMWFERLYLGGMVLGLLNTLMNWGLVQAQVAATPNAGLLPPWFSAATVAIGVGINLLLWYFVARRGSVVAKWIVVVLYAIGLAGIAMTLASGMRPPTLNLVAAIVLLLQTAAVVMLFRADTKPWFAPVS
jgi:hypothetical protein